MIDTYREWLFGLLCMSVIIEVIDNYAFFLSILLPSDFPHDF
jgi:hypothetical protein